MNFNNHKIGGENLAFWEILNFYPILDLYKNRTKANFGNPHAESLDLHLINMIHPKEIVPGLNRFYSGDFQNTVKTCI